MSPTPSYDVETKAFFAALRGEDELGMVLRAHTHIESVLRRLIAELVADASALAQVKLDYSDKVNLAVALGLENEYSKPLLALGALRNRFAHTLDAALTRQEANNLYKALSSSTRNMVNEHYKTVASRRLTAPQRFRDALPREQFIFIAAALRVAVTVALNHAKAARSVA